MFAKSHMKTIHISNVHAITIFLFISIFITFYSSGDKIIAGGDLFIPIDAGDTILSEFSSYNEILYLGMPNVGSTYSIASIPYHLFWHIFQLAGFRLLFIQKLWLFLIIFLPFISMYYFVKSEVTGDNIVSFFSALLYGMNPYILTRICPIYEANIGYALIPLFLAICIRHSKSCSIASIVLISLSSLMFVPLLVNIPSWLCSIGLPLLASFIIIALSKNNHLSDKIRSMLSISLLIGIFYLPFFIVISQILSTNNGTNLTDLISAISLTNRENSIIRIFNMLGYWAFYGMAFDRPYYPYAQWYSSPAGILLGGLFPLIFVCSILFDSRMRNSTFLIGALFITSVFLTKGVNPPAGGLLMWMYEHIPLAVMFREPFTKFMPFVIFSYSLSLGIFIKFIHNRLLAQDNYITSVISKLFLFVSFVLICLYAWPLLSGDAFIGDTGEYPGLRIEIPDYWYNMSKNVNDLVGDDRILVLPQSSFFQMHYFWPGDGYYGVDPIISFIKKPLVTDEAQGGYFKPINSVAFMQMLFETIRNIDNDKFNLYKYCSILNIKYIIVRNDLDWTRIGTEDIGDPESIKNFLENESGIIKLKSFGKLTEKDNYMDKYFIDKIIPKYPYILNISALDIYEIANIDVLPRVYSANRYRIANDLESAFYQINSDKFIPGRDIIIATNSLTASQLDNLRNASKIIASSHDQQVTLVDVTWNRNKAISDRLIARPDPQEKLSIQNREKAYRDEDNFTLNMEDTDHPSITVQKINSAKYNLMINASKPFFLVFSDSYNPRWKLYMNQNSPISGPILYDYDFVRVRELKQRIELFNLDDIFYLVRNPLDEDSHYLANGYANAWYIDRVGSYNLTLYFLPQSWFYLAVLVSLFAFLSSIIYILYHYLNTDDEDKRS